MLKITFVTIFPEIFPGALQFGLSGKALGKLWEFKTVDPREFAFDKHRKVDDEPYGGGAGMVMKAQVIHDALNRALSFYTEPPMIVFMTPRGKLFKQRITENIMKKNKSGIIILCGRYEGIDQRVVDYWKQEHSMMEVSIGDYILFGGEIPAMVLTDACLRMVSGIMNNAESVQYESFSNDLLEYPQYTRPVLWMGQNVPEILLSGNHAKIDKWRYQKSMDVTMEVRPDLLRENAGNKI